MLRTLAHILKRAMSSPEPNRVSIPKNGVDYRGKVVLAPMVRSGELPSRLLALKYGADLVWGVYKPYLSMVISRFRHMIANIHPGPETIDRAIIGTTRRFNPATQTLEFSRYPTSKIQNPELDPEKRESIIYRIHPELEHKKLIYQIGTANPDLAVQAARIVAADVAGIDVNAGCPKPFSTEGGMGAALLKTPDLLCSILTRLVEEVRKEFEIGISVKIRILANPEDTEKLVTRLVKTGITGLTVHCRTTPMRPRERAIRDQLRMIAGICREAGVACLMNGDVTSRTQALQLMEEYGVDGAMIATEAEKNPSCFRADAEGGPVEWRKNWKVVVAEYMKMSLMVQNRWGNTKYLLGQMIPGKDKCYAAMNNSRCYRDCVKALGLEEVEGLMEQAEATDKRLGIPFTHTKAAKRDRKKADAKREEEETNAKKKAKLTEANVEATPIVTSTISIPPLADTPMPQAAAAMSG